MSQNNLSKANKRWRLSKKAGQLQTACF